MQFKDAHSPDNCTGHAIGHQFWWEFRYPGFDRHGKRVAHSSKRSHPSDTTYLKLLSADTDHSFWIPQLAKG
jgi:cytochrome c oxidase subunit 2